MFLNFSYSIYKVLLKQSIQTTKTFITFELVIFMRFSTKVSRDLFCHSKNFFLATLMDLQLLELSGLI